MAFNANCYLECSDLSTELRSSVSSSIFSMSQGPGLQTGELMYLLHDLLFALLHCAACQGLPHANVSHWLPREPVDTIAERSTLDTPSIGTER